MKELRGRPESAGQDAGRRTGQFGFLGNPLHGCQQFGQAGSRETRLQGREADDFERIAPERFPKAAEGRRAEVAESMQEVRVVALSLEALQRTDRFGRLL